MGAGVGQLIVVVVCGIPTLTTADVVWRPKASRARADNVWLPPDTPVVFQTIAYGDVVASAPSGAPSSRNCTPTTPMSSAAFADTATVVPDTVAPLAGAVIVTVGAERSLFTVTVTVVADPVPPLVSRAIADRKCVPLDAVVVSQFSVNGLTVSSAPSVAPSRMNCTPAIVPLPGVAVAVTATALPDTVAPLAGAVSVAVEGAAPAAVLSDVVTTSKVGPVPSVQARPI